MRFATVLLRGWGDLDSPTDKLAAALQSEFGPGGGFHQFEYEYGRRSGELKAFACLEVLAGRLRAFLSDRGLLASDTRLNFVGYSTGGMIALYAAGSCPEILQRMNRYVSIASPHHGAVNIELIITLIAPFMNLADESQLIQLTDPIGTFIASSYPEAAKKVFANVPKEHLLQVYSQADLVAPPWSSLRFVKGTPQFPKACMLSFDASPVKGTDHLKISNTTQTITRTKAFLGNRIIQLEPSATRGDTGGEVEVRATVNRLNPGTSLLIDGAAQPFAQLDKRTIRFALKPGVKPATKTIRLVSGEGYFGNEVWFECNRLVLNGATPAVGRPGQRIGLYGGLFIDSDMVRVGNRKVGAASAAANAIEFVLPEVPSGGTELGVCSSTGRLASNLLPFAVGIHLAALSNARAAGSQEVSALGSMFRPDDVVWCGRSRVPTTYVDEHTLTFAMPDTQAAKVMVRVRSQDGTLVSNPLPLLADVILANPNTREFHRESSKDPRCQLGRMAPKHRRLERGIDAIKRLIAEDYNGCAWCMPEYNVE